MSQIENWAPRGMAPQYFEVLGRDEDFVYIKSLKPPVLSGHYELSIPNVESYRYYSQISKSWEYRFPRAMYEDIMRRSRPQRRHG
jgi:hypothetical protein